MVPSRALRGWLTVLALPLVALLALAGCAGGGEVADGAATPAPASDPQVVADVTAAFATYRAGVVQGDAAAVLGSLDAASAADMGRLADLAREIAEPSLRQLPAAEQLLVLTYRLRPELLQADDPYAALVEGGFGGQDRSLGDLGSVDAAGEDRALGVVTDPQTGAPTPLRWRFTREDGAWRLDLVEAHRLLSQAIANSARRTGVAIDTIVAATLVDLSGEDPAVVQRLYAQPPAV